MAYFLVYRSLWLISLLPLRVLYLLADAFYVLVYYIIKYRKEVVFKNLDIAFPEKSQEEKVKIAKQFYKNFIDSFIETIKMLSVSTDYIGKRFKANWEVVNQFHASGRSVQIHLPHNFNWEWGNMMAAKEFNFTLIAVYQPISNKIFDRLFRHLRSRSGTNLLRANAMKEDMMAYRNQQYVLGLVADQNPSNMWRAWWMDFFTKKAPFVSGPAKNAIASDTVVIFGFVHKKKRGHYELVMEVAEEFPRQSDEQTLTKNFVHYMENVIRTYPDMWLWTHRRWKNEYHPDYPTIPS